MSDGPLEEARECWNRLAHDWRVQVGDDGDSNRRLNSDPVLWGLAGDVRGLAVLDAGCDTGYLSRKLPDRGALVTGVDFAESSVVRSQTCTSQPHPLLSAVPRTLRPSRPDNFVSVASGGERMRRMRRPVTGSVQSWHFLTSSVKGSTKS
jgi:hypothetical protein